MSGLGLRCAETLRHNRERSTQPLPRSVGFMNQRAATSTERQAKATKPPTDHDRAPSAARCGLGLGEPTLSDIVGTMFVALTAPEIHGGAGRSAIGPRRAR